MNCGEQICLSLKGKEGVDMNTDFVRTRISQLRLQKGVSEYQMSYDLGHSRGYVNNISSGKALPSMGEFFSICEYFGITPLEFFDTAVQNPGLLRRAEVGLRRLDDADLALMVRCIERLGGKE